MEQDIDALADYIGNELVYNPRAYKRLANSFFLIEMGMDDYTEDDIKDIIKALKKFDSFMSRISEKHNGRDEINKHLTDVLQMTSITSVAASEEKTERKKAIKINNVVINDNSSDIDTPTNAIVKVYKEFLGKNKELIDSYIEYEQRMLTKEDRHDAFFRNRQELCKDNSGNTVYIGLSSITSDKMTFVGKLCEFMKSKDKKAHVIWKYNDEVVYDSEQR